MTLDEAIKYEKESLQHCKRMLEKIYEDNLQNKLLTFEVKQHEHLAEWLEELKLYKSLAPRELVSENQKNDRAIEYNKGFDYGFKTGYNKAIGDFVKFASDMPTVETEDGEVRPMWLEEIAEQLKAGDGKKIYCTLHE